MTPQTANRIKQKPLLIGILLLLVILAGIFSWPTSTLPYHAGQFILVTSNEYNWPEDHIFALLPDGSHFTRLARGTEPACSPDGRRIAFVGVDKPEEHFYANPAYIYVMDSDGTNIKQLTSGETRGRSPEWSPDGEKIIFQKVGPKGGIGIVDINTLALTEYHPPDVAGIIFGFAWSPSGFEIIFVADTEISDRGKDILYLVARGNEVHKIADGEIKAPAWSPDGENIVFLYGDKRNTLRVIKPDGHVLSEIILPGGMYIWSSPKWSSDSQYIIFSGSHLVGQATQDAVFIIDRDGSNLKTLVQAGWFTWGRDVGENFPLPRGIHYGEVDWCEVK